MRVICTNCKEEFKPDKQQLDQLGITKEDIKAKKLYYGKGLECNQAPYLIHS